MATKATQTRRKASVRARIVETVEENFDAQIRGFVTEALGASKTAWGSCKHCGHRVGVQVEDWGARTRVLETLLNQGYGRPSADEEERQAMIIVERPCNHSLDELVETFRRRLVKAGWTPPPE